MIAQMIEWFEDSRRELYDLGVDPSETTDLAASRPEEVIRLRALLETWGEQVGARLPTRAEPQ